MSKLMVETMRQFIIEEWICTLLIIKHLFARPSDVSNNIHANIVKILDDCKCTDCHEPNVTTKKVRRGVNSSPDKSL